MNDDGRFPDFWLSTPLGRRFLAGERRATKTALDQVFGQDLLQVGSWGDPTGFVRFARTQRATLVDWRPGRGQKITSDPGLLGIGTDSVDAVLLPHTLERTASPHGILREVDRVLRPDGHLIVLGFNAVSAWGLRHLGSGSGFPAGTRRVLREGRLRDWLELLSFDVAPSEKYCYCLPFSGFGVRVGVSDFSPARRFLPLLAGGFLLSAKKRVFPLTPVRQRWRRRRLRVVGGLEPTTRNTCESHPPVGGAVGGPFGGAVGGPLGPIVPIPTGPAGIGADRFAANESRLVALGHPVQ